MAEILEFAKRTKLLHSAPPYGLFFQEKIDPLFSSFSTVFFLKIASLMAETNFTLGPTSKTNQFHLLFLVIHSWPE